MPFTPHPRAILRRRSLLASAAGAALLAGCSDAIDPAATDGVVSVADRARARAARDSQVLAGRYAAVIAAHPALAARLRPLRAEVVRHAKAFGGTSAAPSATVSTSASVSVSASPAPSPVPADPKSALADLAAAERTLAGRRTEALLKVPGELARLMASVAAAGAAHAYLLTEGAK